MPPGEASVAPAAPQASNVSVGGPEGPRIPVGGGPNPPEVAARPPDVLARQQDLANQLHTQGPDARLSTLAQSIPSSEDRAALQQKAFAEITNMNLGMDLATATPTEIIDALKQKGWQGDTATVDYILGGRDHAIAQKRSQEQEAVQPTTAQPQVETGQAAASQTVPENAAVGNAQTAEQTSPNQPLEAAQGDVITKEQRKNQEREAQKARIGQVFGVVAEIYKEKPDLVAEYCKDWVKRDPDAAKAFAEAGKGYMDILMQKKAFNKAIIVGGFLAALWLIFNTMTSDGQH